MKKQLAELLREIDKESQDAFAALATEQRRRGAREDRAICRGALEKYRQAIGARSRTCRDSFEFRCRAASKLGQWKEGLAELREAVRRDPGNAKMQAALRGRAGTGSARVRRQRQRKTAASLRRRQIEPCG